MPITNLTITKRNGQREAFDMAHVRKALAFATHELPVDPVTLEAEAAIAWHDGIGVDEIQASLIRTALHHLDPDHPAWDQVAARLLRYDLYNRAQATRGLAEPGYGDYPALVQRLVKEGQYTDDLITRYTPEDLATAGRWIHPERDDRFRYAGLQLLTDRYLVRTRDGQIAELPQEVFLGIALTLALAERPDERLAYAEQFYTVLSRLDVTMATPTFANARRPQGQLSSCFVDTIPDSLEGIYHGLSTFARVSKAGGGLGSYLGKIRAERSAIQGVPHVAKGILPWMRLYNDTAVAVDQLGQRSGAVTLWLDIWHPDVLDFIEARTPQGDERRKARDVFPGLCIPDAFMRAVQADLDWHLFDPHTVRTQCGWSLEDSYGPEWDARYAACVARDTLPRTTIPAKTLWRTVLQAIHRSGTPFVLFRDTVNRTNPNAHAGLVYSSNLCVTGDTRLATHRGYLQAQDLFETGEALHVTLDTRTTPAQTPGTTIDTAIPMHQTAQCAPIFRVETQQGFTLRATAWHPFYRMTADHHVDKIPLEQLRPGDRVLIQSGHGQHGSFHDPDLGWIMGWMAGDDTWYSDRRACLDFYHDKQRDTQHAEQRIARVLARYGLVIHPMSIAKGAVLTPKARHQDGAQRDRIPSTPLGDVLNLHGMTPTTKHLVPECVWQGTETTQIAYLQGVYQSDGTVKIVLSAKAGAIQLSSTHSTLLQSIQQILINFGVYSRLYSTRPDHTNFLPNGRRGQRSYTCRAQWRLDVTDRAGREWFLTHAILNPHSHAKLQHLHDQLQPKSRQPKHRFTATIRAIVPDGEEPTYDTTQPTHHSLIFNGFVTGNCTEILQNQSPSDPEAPTWTTADQITQSVTPGDLVVCNLASIHLGHMTTPADLDRTIPIVIRMLDDVITQNHLPVPQATRTNLRYRAIGLGVHGYQQYLVDRGIAWESEAHVAEAEALFERIAYRALEASATLAEERGAYPLFPGSGWEDGSIFQQRGYHGPAWDALQARLRTHGLRNGYLLAIAPTGSTSILADATPGIDPVFDHVWREDKHGFAVTRITPGITPATRDQFVTAHQADQAWSIRAAGARQRHLDQGQSLNLYRTATMDARQLSAWYQLAWESGVKTVYYFRNFRPEAPAERSSSSPDVSPEIATSNPPAVACLGCEL